MLPARAGTWASLASREPDTKSVAGFIALKLSFMAMQMLWGLWKRQVGLVAPSFHTGIDCLALACSLFAMITSHDPPSKAQSYGFGRLEVFAGFTHAVFLIFVACFTVIEAGHYLYLPPEIHDHDLVMACLALGLNLLGTVMFCAHSRLEPSSIQEGKPGAKEGLKMARELNMHGVYLHVYNDTISSGGLLAATGFFRWRPWAPLYGLLYLMVAAVIVQSCLPLIRRAGLILLQTKPESLQVVLDRAVRELSCHAGVLQVRDQHWWEHYPGHAVGSLHVRVRAEADAQAILRFARGVLGRHLSVVTVQVDKDIPVAP